MEYLKSHCLKKVKPLFEDSKISFLHNSTVDDSVHIEETCDRVVALEELRTSKELEASSLLPATELHTLQSQSGPDKYSCDVLLLDDAKLRMLENDTEIVRTCDRLASAEISIHLEDNVSSFSVKESKMSISFPVGLHAQTLSVEEKTETDCKNDKELVLALPDVSSSQELKESENFQAKIDNLVSLADELQGEESHNQSEEGNALLGHEIETMQEEPLEKQMKSNTVVALSYQIMGESLSGRGHRKRRMSYQPFLSPFRNLLTSRPSRKKVRKLNPH